MVSAMRAQRIAERIQEELSEILIYEITDPGLQWVNITDVTVDRELAYANIFVSAVEGAERRDEIMAAFGRARGYLRRQLAQRIDLRVFPQLRFHWDPTPEQAQRIEMLLDSLQQPEPPNGLEPVGGEPAQDGPEEGPLADEASPGSEAADSDG